MTITLLNTPETYQSLSTFDNVQGKNEAIKKYKIQFKNELTKSTLAVLDFISQWACKYAGVCYLSKSKIANELGISRRTVIRACDLLEKLGIITQYATKRAAGDKRRSTNAIVINPFSQCHNEMSQQDNLLDNQNIKNTEVTDAASKNEPKEKGIKDALLSKLPQPLKVLGYFFNAQDVYKHVGTIYKAKHAIDNKIAIEEHTEEFETTIKQVISSFKLGKIRNFDGVLYAAIQSLCKSIKLKSELSGLFGF